MILTKPGILTTAQALTAGNTVSEWVIDLAALGIQGFGPGVNNLWLDIETVVADSGGTADTYVINLVVDDTEALTSPVYYIISIPMVHGDPRMDAAGKKIYSGMLPDQIWQMAKEGYRYLGLYCVLADVGGTAGVTINAAISPSKPRTEDNTQVLRSNVTIPS
jgi:hypothetical protein